MKSEFISAVANHDLSSVRMMLSNELLLDPRGKTFSEMLLYAKDNLNDLFEVNKVSNFEIPADKNLWDDKLVSKVKRDLNSNFSVEKLALFQELAMWVGRDKAAGLNKSEAEQRQRKRSHQDSSSTTANHDRATDASDDPIGDSYGKIVTIGGVILEIVGTCLEKGAMKTMLCVVGGMAIVGGIILYAVKKSE